MAQDRTTPTARHGIGAIDEAFTAPLDPGDEVTAQLTERRS